MLIKQGNVLFFISPISVHSDFTKYADLSQNLSDKQIGADYESKTYVIYFHEQPENSHKWVKGQPPQCSACNVSVAGDLPTHAALCKFDFEPSEPSFLMWNAETEQSHN